MHWADEYYHCLETLPLNSSAVTVGFVLVWLITRCPNIWLTVIHGLSKCVYRWTYLWDGDSEKQTVLPNADGNPSCHQGTDCNKLKRKINPFLPVCWILGQGQSFPPSLGTHVLSLQPGCVTATALLCLLTETRAQELWDISEAIL